MKNWIKCNWQRVKHYRASGKPFWIPIAAALSVIGALTLFIPFGIFIYALLILATPFIIAAHYFSWRAFERKAGVLTGAGLHFPRAYDGFTLPWNRIRSVERVHGHVGMFYRILSERDDGTSLELEMPHTDDDFAFGRLLAQHYIPYRAVDWRGRLVSEPN